MPPGVQGCAGAPVDASCQSSQRQVHLEGGVETAKELIHSQNQAELRAEPWVVGGSPNRFFWQKGAPPWAWSGWVA